MTPIKFTLTEANRETSLKYGFYESFVLVKIEDKIFYIVVDRTFINYNHEDFFTMAQLYDAELIT